MTGAVKAAQAAAWLPFAVDAIVTDRRRRVAHALPATREPISALTPRSRVASLRIAATNAVPDVDRRRAADARARALTPRSGCARGSSARAARASTRRVAAHRRRRRPLAAPCARARARASRASRIRRSCRSRSAPRTSRRRFATHPVVIVCGETGSGKTTQLPKICLDAGRGERGLIGHTQPRRIAARAVAARIAQELGTRARRRGRLQGPLHRPARGPTRTSS